MRFVKGIETCESGVPPPCLALSHILSALSPLSTLSSPIAVALAASQQSACHCAAAPASCSVFSVISTHSTVPFDCLFASLDFKELFDFVGESYSYEFVRCT